MVNAAQIVAHAYVDEHLQAIHSATLEMAVDLSRVKPLFDQDRDKFHKFMTMQATGQGLSAAILKSDGSAVARPVDRAVFSHRLAAAHQRQQECEEAEAGERRPGAQAVRHDSASIAE